LVSGKTAWRTSESLARYLLEDLGYKIIEVHKRIEVNGVEIGEVDFVAEKDGKIYAIEVKAGSVDLSGVRQAYVNAKLINAIPLVVARGADDRARELATKLGVGLLLVPDIVYASVDDLYMIVREVIFDVINEFLNLLDYCGKIEDKDREILEAISKTDNIREASSMLNISLEDMAKNIASLKKKGILPRGNYRVLKLASRLLLYCSSKEKSVPRP